MYFYMTKSGKNVQVQLLEMRDHSVFFDGFGRNGVKKKLLINVRCGQLICSALFYCSFIGVAIIVVNI